MARSLRSREELPAMELLTRNSQPGAEELCRASEPLNRQQAENGDQSGAQATLRAAPLPKLLEGGVTVAGSERQVPKDSR